MKKLLSLLLLFIIVPLVFISCKPNVTKVHITTDIDSYELKSSSVQGIKMSPQLESDVDIDEVQYRWITTDGSFIDPLTASSKKEIVNTGDSVLWSAISNTDTQLPSSIDITLKIETKKNNDVIAETKITVQRDNDLYKIIK